jgi:hypothetical protein
VATILRPAIAAYEIGKCGQDRLGIAHGERSVENVNRLEIAGATFDDVLSLDGKLAERVRVIVEIGNRPQHGSNVSLGAFLARFEVAAEDAPRRV